MPSKGSKAASRQAKLSRRKRRDKIGPQQMDSGPIQSASLVNTGISTGSDTAVAEPTTGTETVVQDDVVAEVSSQPQPAPRPATRRRRPGRRVAEPGDAQIYRYLGRELRQIGVITALIAAILVGLTFVLG